METEGELRFARIWGDVGISILHLTTLRVAIRVFGFIRVKSTNQGHCEGKNRAWETWSSVLPNARPKAEPLGPNIQQAGPSP